MSVLDDDGLVVRAPGSILTYSGLEVDPLTMTVEDVRIADIAHSLALQCRYGGHSQGFYSVARHSILVSNRLPAHLALSGLLHDAAEAYLGDVVRPLKHGPIGQEFLLAEEYVESIINQRFGVRVDAPEIKEADRCVLTQLELAPDTGLRYTEDGDWHADEQAFLSLFAELQHTLKPAIVGISGYARSGKDTMGQILVDDFGFELVKFAGLLYDMLYAMDPIVETSTGFTSLQQAVNTFGWEILKASGPRDSKYTTRAYLQRLGTEGVRDHLGQDTWVNAAIAALKPGGRYVFTDVRFPNEAKAVLDAGGTVWRMQRAGNAPESGHSSEVLVDDLPATYQISSPEEPDFAMLRKRLATIAGDILA